MALITKSTDFHGSDHRVHELSLTFTQRIYSKDIPFSSQTGHPSAGFALSLPLEARHMPVRFLVRWGDNNQQLGQFGSTSSSSSTSTASSSAAGASISTGRLAQS